MRLVLIYLRPLNVKYPVKIGEKNDSYYYKNPIFLKLLLKKRNWPIKWKKKFAMSHVLLETRSLFLLERYVWFILMSHIFKMTCVNNLEKKSINCLWSGSCTQYNCFVSKFFFSSLLLSFWLFIFIMQQVISLFWSVGTISWRCRRDWEKTKWFRKKWFFNERLIYYLWGIKKPWTNVQTLLLFATGCQFISGKNKMIAKTSCGRQFSGMEKPELR